MRKMYRCQKGLIFYREFGCDLSTKVELKNPHKFIACKDCNQKKQYDSGDYYCIADKMYDSEEFSKEKVPEEIVIKLPTQFAVDLSDALMSGRLLFSPIGKAFYPYGKFSNILFSALEEQLYKVIAPDEYKRIHEILDKYGDEE